MASKIKGYLPVSPQTPILDVFLWAPSAHLKKMNAPFPVVSIFRIIICWGSLDELIDFTSDLYKGQQGAQIGAPYRITGLIRESNSVNSALKGS